MKIEPRHLVFFASVLDNGGVTDAAQELGIAQPALSRMIGALEKRVGAPLLESRRKPVVATVLGEQLAEQGRAIRLSLYHADDLIDEVRLGHSGTVRIGAPPFFSERILPEMLVEYRRTFPAVNFEVRTTYLDHLLDLVERHEVDIVFSTTVTLERGRPSESRVVSDLSHAVFCRPGHPALQAGRFSPELLGQQEWISYGQEAFLYNYTMESLAQFGIQQVRIGLKADSGGMILRMLEMSDCLCVLPVYAVLSEVKNGKLALLPTPRLRTVPASVTTTKSSESSAVVSRFAKWIAEDLRVRVADGKEYLDEVLEEFGF